MKIHLNRSEVEGYYKADLKSHPLFNLFMHAMFVLAILLIIFVLFNGCTQRPAVRSNSGVQIVPYPVGTLELKDSHHRQILTWPAEYDTVIIYGTKMVFKFMPKTDQVFGEYYQESTYND